MTDEEKLDISQPVLVKREVLDRLTYEAECSRAVREEMLSELYKREMEIERLRHEWEEATGSEFAKKLATARAECKRLRGLAEKLLEIVDHICDEECCCYGHGEEIEEIRDALEANP